MKKLMKMVLSAWCLVLGAEAVAAAGMLRAEGDLPDGYREVASIEVPNGSFVDTLYRPNQNTRVVMDVTVQGEIEYWFGCWTNDYSQGAFGLGNDGSQGVYFAINNDGGSYSNALANGRHTVEINNWQMLVDDEVWMTKPESSQGDFQLDRSLYLFAQNRCGTAYVPETQGTIICHGCTIKEGDEVLRQFVPCARTSDGVQGMYDQAGDKFYALVEKLDKSVAAFRDHYLLTHDFTSETFVEFNQQQGDELEGFLEAAKMAMENATSDYSTLDVTKDKRSGSIGVSCNGYGYVNVRLTLRNHTSDDWTLSKRVVELIKELAYGNGNNSASLVIEANPDYFPDPQTYNGHPVVNAFCSLELNGGPIVIITNDRLPLDFEVGGYSDLRSYRFSTSVLYGLTFEGCKNPASSGGAIQTGIARDKRNAVRMINCMFSNCSAEEGGAYYSSSTTSTEFYCPVQYGITQSNSDPNRFYPFTGSQLTQGDFEGVRGSHLYHCTFDSCTAKNNGGAVYGNRAESGTVITDCTFMSCKAEEKEGGGIAYVQTAYRCTFNQCMANQGGGCYGAYNVVSCLFRECSSRSGGGAIDRAADDRIHIVSCTLDNCAATDKNGYAIVTYKPGEDKVIGCVLVNSSIDPRDHIETGTYSFDSASFFIAPPDDYHIKTDSASLSQLRLTTAPDTSQPFSTKWALYIGGNKDWTYSSLYDRDGHPFVLQEPLLIAGCYRGYTVQQWEDEKQRKKSYEWKTMNPLVVTVQEDIVDPKDGKISFREACQYLERHQAAPGRICADQWPKITFALPTGKRWVNLSTVVALDDAKRAESFGTGFSGRQPVIIDGGAAGLEFRNGGTGKDLLELNTAGVVSNVLFNGGTVAVRGNAVPEHGWVKFPVVYTNRLGEAVTRYEARQVTNDRNVLFDNCAFAGGTADGCLASSAWGNVRFVGCSFFGSANGGKVSAAELTVLPQWISRFECCTFSRMSGVNQVLKFRDEGGELRLANCTFADNAVSMADVMIETVEDGVHGTFRALNCIFADGDDKAYSKDLGNTNVYCPCEKPKKKGELMVNIVTSDPQEVFDSQRTSRSVNGVVQYVYKPRHAFTARYGCGAYTFDDGVTMEQPVLDIFHERQTGLFHSMGSFYIDDREAPSIAVSTAEDVTDPYDDVISLREAVAYGGEKDGSFAQGQAVTPTFGDGVTSLSVTGAIHVAAETAYKDFALVIQPGKDQTLTISSATNSQNGVFVQDAGTRLLQFDRVRFDRCGSIRGDGGVLDTAGRYRFDDCVFDCCWSTGVGHLPGDEIVAGVDSAISDIHDAGIDDDFGLAAIRQITNRMDEVEGKMREISNIMSQKEPDMALVKELADAAGKKIYQSVEIASATLAGAQAGLSEAVLAAKDDEDKRSRLEAAMGVVTACKASLNSFAANEIGRSGVIRAGTGSDGILFGVTASRCYAMSAGGVIASEGNLVGVNLTFCGNTARSGAAVLCTGGTNLFASVAFVDNVSETNGAVHVSGGACGIVNSIIIGDVTADGGATNIQYSLCGADIAKNEVFLDVGPLVGISSNGIEHLYYPLAPAGLAVGTGAHVFFMTEKGGDDIAQAGWIKGVLYSTDPDGFDPRPQPLVGTKGSFNTHLVQDQLGNPIESWDKYLRPLPASMGPVPKAVAVVPVTPGEPVVFDTAVEATNAMAAAVITPSDDVAAALGSDAAIATYRNMFGFDVVPTSDGKWAVAALLNPPDWTNVVQSAQEATKQIPVADIASLELCVPTNVTVKGCGVPGFYYSLYGAAGVRALPTTETIYGPVLCGSGKDVEFSGVVKPSDAAGFFSVGVLLAPGVGPSDRAELDPPAITDVGTYGN